MRKAFNTLMATAVITSVVTVASVSSTDVLAQQSGLKERVRAAGRTAGRLDAKTQGANIRVSQLMGYNIQNSQGESVGEIKDIVVNSRTGKVQYAAVTYGGFLGLGDKMFAVPFEAFKVQADADEAADGDLDADDYVLVLDVKKQQLEGLQGFDEDNWPNMADQQWAADLDKRYGVNRNMDDKDRLLRANRRSKDRQ